MLLTKCSTSVRVHVPPKVIRRAVHRDCRKPGHQPNPAQPGQGSDQRTPKILSTAGIIWPGQSHLSTEHTKVQGQQASSPRLRHHQDPSDRQIRRSRHQGLHRRDLGRQEEATGSEGSPGQEQNTETIPDEAISLPQKDGRNERRNRSEVRHLRGRLPNEASRDPWPLRVLKETATPRVERC